MSEVFDILICCNRCKISSFGYSEGYRLYNFSDFKKLAVFYCCPYCNESSLTCEWVLTDPTGLWRFI